MGDEARTAMSFGEHRVALIDCCSLLNLYATRRLAEIARTLPVRLAVAEAVVGEAAYILRGGDGDDADEREPVDLAPLLRDGLLEVWRPETEAEYSSLVSFAAEIDDGEAMTCALALHRSAAVVTDDRKTLRVLPMGAPQLIALTTSQVLKYWSDTGDVGEPALRTALGDVQSRARFAPGRQDPLLVWWRAILGSR